MEAVFAAWLAKFVAVAHAAIVGITMYGIVGVILGRYSRRSLQRPMTWVFMGACVSQLASYAVFRECLLTRWEKSLLQQAGEPKTFTGTFLQRFIPELPDHVAHTGIPLIVLAIFIGLLLQLARRGPASP
ncbi:DUF2784 family protein [Roseateles sp.]|uniref:DUF2784 family protein n=1 Tax=Roseateles sp. TaxID=1971397 RepID=UPI003BA441B5